MEIKMTRRELVERIRTAAPKWMAEDMDAAITERQDPDWWLDGEMRAWDEIDYLMDYDTTDFGQSRKFKMAFTRIERAVGCQRRLGKGEQTQVLTSDGCRTLREGAWVFSKRFDELISDR